MICIFRNKYIKLLYMYNNLFSNYSKKYLQIGGVKAQTLDELEIYVTLSRNQWGQETITIRGLDENKDSVLHFRPNQILDMKKSESTWSPTKLQLLNMKLFSRSAKFDTMEFFNAEEEYVKKQYPKKEFEAYRGEEDGNQLKTYEFMIGTKESRDKLRKMLIEKYGIQPPLSEIKATKEKLLKSKEQGINIARKKIFDAKKKEDLENNEKLLKKQKFKEDIKEMARLKKFKRNFPLAFTEKEKEKQMLRKEFVWDDGKTYASQRKLAEEAAKKGQERISDNETKQKLFLSKQPAIDKLNQRLVYDPNKSDQTLVYDPNKSDQTLVYDPIKEELSSMNNRILKLENWLIDHTHSMNTSGAIPLKKYKLPGPAYIDKDPEIPKEKHEYKIEEPVYELVNTGPKTAPPIPPPPTTVPVKQRGGYKKYKINRLI